MYYETKVSKRLLILILSSQHSFYRLNFWISASCLSASFKVRLTMVTYFFLRSDFRLYGFKAEYRISYILACNLQTKADIKNLDSHICSKFMKGHGTKI